MTYGRLFDEPRRPCGPCPEDWHPEIPPLNGEHRIILNAETNGLRWWEEDRPIGWSYLFPVSGRQGYLPIRHSVGDNLPIESVHAWLRSMRGMQIDNTNTKFDLHMSRADGVDLTEQDNRFGSADHFAALLDDHRMRFNLDGMSKDVLGWDVEGDTIGKKPASIETEAEFHELPPWEVAPYAVRNVMQVNALIDEFQKGIARENLGRVLALEQDVLPAVVEMEKNGLYVDVPLLHQWRDEVKAKIEDKLHFIFRETGLRISSPDSPKDLTKLFQRCGIPITSFTDTGKPSFTAASMKSIQHPCIAAILEAGQLADLDSKYLTKYSNAVRADGWLRFNLHQLRAGHDENDKHGTVSGRFSAAGDKHGGFNPQQVVAVEKQLERGWCPDYVVRRLFIPGPGEVCLYAADMMQVEYRLFAHYANSPAVMAVYRANPLADYHKTVMELLHQVNPNLNRKLVKNVNFAKIYGAGLVKFALMLGQITEKQYMEFVARQRRRDWSVKDDPALGDARGLNGEYDEMFPEVKPLLSQASRTAEERGYVFTLMGRRARLNGRFHSALNRIVQGGAADINKRLVVEAYKRRKSLDLVMRCTVHDELLGGLRDLSKRGELDAVLNTQYFPDLRVPILWDSKVGANWAACK